MEQVANVCVALYLYCMVQALVMSNQHVGLAIRDLRFCSNPNSGKLWSQGDALN